MTAVGDNSFAVHSCKGCAKLEFFALETNRRGDVEAFSVRMTDENLRAAAHVDAFSTQCLTDYFKDLAAHWKGWKDSRDWASLEEELVLSATNDGRGHIELRVAMRSGPIPGGWKVHGTISTEAGLLDGIASDCEQFAGRRWRK